MAVLRDISFVQVGLGGPSLTVDSTPISVLTVPVPGVQGPQGKGLTIKGTLSSSANLPATPTNPEDAYLIDGDLWVWTGSAWANAGAIRGPIGPQGPTGAAGAQGVPGTTGPAGPTGAQGLKGDQGDVGPQGPTGPQGPIGPQGIKGDKGDIGNTGPVGATGKGVRYGDGAPSNALGVDGEFYINRLNWNLYGPKTNGAWGTPISMVGPTGPAGPQGPIGQTGPAGTPGAPGDPGAPGATGPAGKSMLSGNTDPSNAIGQDGDFYYRYDNKTIFGPKTSGAWGTGMLLSGPAGPTGPAGPAGATGPTGPAGSLPPEGIPTRILLVQTGGSYPTKPVGGYAEYLGSATPPTAASLDGDIWTQIATTGAAVNKLGQFTPPASPFSPNTYAWTLPTITSGARVILTFSRYAFNEGAPLTATLSKVNTTTRTITPILSPFWNPGFGSAVYVFDADANTSGSTITFTLGAPTTGVALGNVYSAMMCTWYSGLVAAASPNLALRSPGATSGATHTSPTGTTSVANGVEFTIIQDHYAAVPTASYAITPPMVIQTFDHSITTDPDLGHGLAANLTPVASGSVVGGRTWTNYAADGSQATGAYGLTHTIVLPASTSTAASAVRLVRVNGTWQTLAGS